MLQTSQKINLREERDFSDKLNATFHFIRSNFRSLLRTLFLYVTPVALISGILSGFYQARVLRSISGTQSHDTYGDYNFFNQINSVSYLFTVLFMMISFFVLSLAVYSFMVVYQDEEGEVQPSSVWYHMKENMVKAIYSGIVLTIVTFLSLFLLGFGIYFGVVMSLFLIVMVREELGFVDTIERCFYLIKGNWWATFGLLFVASIIQGIIGWLAALPVGAITLMRLAEIPGTESDLLFITANTLSTVLSIYIYAIVAIALGFQYFNLVEKKDGTGLMEQAELIGQQNQHTTANEGLF